MNSAIVVAEAVTAQEAAAAAAEEEEDDETSDAGALWGPGKLERSGSPTCMYMY